MMSCCSKTVSDVFGNNLMNISSKIRGKFPEFMIEEPRTGLMVREAPVDPVDPSCSTGPVWVTQCFKPAPGLFIQHADLYLLVLPFMF